MRQARQRPLSATNETIGMLSYQASGVAQPGQAERGAHTLRPSGTRAITTFRKLPRTRPKTTAVVTGAGGGCPFRSPHGQDGRLEGLGAALIGHAQQVVLVPRGDVVAEAQVGARQVEMQHGG